LWRRLAAEGRVRPRVETDLGFREFDREAVTVRQLLTHTSGLDDPEDAYYSQFPEHGARKALVGAIARRPLVASPGADFVYSDLNFILLAEIVERVAGVDLAEFARREIFDPLGMVDTMFNPPREMAARTAPTEWVGPQRFQPATAAMRRMLRGEVHQGSAAIQDGIAGHAGLFSTANDLATFCQMLLDAGAHGGRRVFSPATVAAMSRNQLHLPYGDQRGLGWDISTMFSKPRGDLMAGGYGHTGWTGGSIWIVPEDQLFIVILTNRLHPKGAGDASPIRARVANVVASSLLGPPRLRR
jgi:CubicO group peptidase (beta-lactamase class C family)